MATKRAKKPKRFQYILDKEGEFYVLRVGGAAVDTFWTHHFNKSSALYAASNLVKDLSEKTGQHSELVVRKEDGRFSVPRTYGDDPKESKG